jgi:hypothetical protein
MCLVAIDGSFWSAYFLAYIKAQWASALSYSLTMSSDNFLEVYSKDSVLTVSNNYSNLLWQSFISFWS